MMLRIALELRSEQPITSTVVRAWSKHPETYNFYIVTWYKAVEVSSTCLEMFSFKIANGSNISLQYLQSQRSIMEDSSSFGALSPKH